MYVHVCMQVPWKGLFRLLLGFLGLSILGPGAKTTGALEEMALRVHPKGSLVLLWGILPQIIMVTPNIETLHSTIGTLDPLGYGDSDARDDDARGVHSSQFGYFNHFPKGPST